VFVDVVVCCVGYGDHVCARVCIIVSL
jgi:hypothetical protein